MPLQTGHIINNRYRIVNLLGQGGFGAVYRAWDLNMECPRALKENLDTSPESQRQFKTEARILGQLTHQNLPNVIDHFIVKGQGQYLVMDFVEGEDLQQKLNASGGSLPEKEVIPWIQQVCDALVYLHAQNPPIIHRDIKPANIKITPGGNAMLVDFGIAKIYDPHLSTTIGARAVTPGFSPPEQYGQGKTGPRTDIYALGATLYTALTGIVPPDSVDRMTGTQPPMTSIRTLKPAVSPRLDWIVTRAMQLDWTKRFGTVLELKNALGAGQSRDSQTYVQKTSATQVVTQIPFEPSRPVRKKTLGWVPWATGILILGLGYLLFSLVNPPGPGEDQETVQVGMIQTDAAQTVVAEMTQEAAGGIDTGQEHTPLPATETPIEPTQSPVPTETPYPTSTPRPVPQMDRFLACKTKCYSDGSNAVATFPEKTTEIWVHWNYWNIPVGASYVRRWTMDGMEWARYQCNWQGPENGIDDIKLWDVDGLRSGEWQVSVLIDGQVVFNRSIYIEGNWTFWEPAGTFDTCYGNR